jgi:hypothetical protein
MTILFNIWVWLFPLAIVCGITGCVLASINGKHNGENWMWTMTGIMVVWLILTIFFIFTL